MDKIANGTEKKGLLETSITTVKIVLCFWLAFNTFILVYFGIISKTDVLATDPVKFVDGSVLPSDIRENEFLFFVTREDVAVYINGELRQDFKEERDVNVPGGIIKKIYMMVPLVEADSGAEFSIVFLAESDENRDTEIFVSTRSGAVNYLLREGGLSFFLATIILIFSFIVFIVSIVLRYCYKLKIDMMYGALGILIISSWLVTDSYLFQFIFRIKYVNGIMNYMLCFMIPFAPGIYLNSVQGGIHRRSMSVMMILSSLNAIVWPLLHFTGILNLFDIRNIVNIILAFMAVTAISILIYDAVKGNTKRYRYTFIGFLGFLICCIIELSLIVWRDSNTSLPMVAGLGFLLTFVVIQQVDDLRKVNTEKQQAIDISEAKSRFLASMSHEIRTPINAILGMNEMILRENSDRTIGEYSRSIKSSGKILLMLVNDVLDFSKIEAGKLEINEARFLMSDVLYDVISLIKERADEKNLELKTEIKEEIPNELISDEVRIRQILINLLNNAVKYTDKGTITLSLCGEYTDDGYELNIKVKDTGKGIPENEKDKLFEAFSRADIRTNVNIEGTGLGLAIVKSIVDSMKGSIHVDSEYGIGSEFQVRLPVKYLSKTPLNSDFLKEEHRYSNESGHQSFTAPDARILAVDDNQSNLKIVKLFLKRTGIKLNLCSSGNRAAELCREKKYDLILLDHMMPQPDGIETLHIIRNDPASLNKDTKAVVLTANAIAGSRQFYIDEGFDDYIAKPIDSELLEHMVMKLLPKEKVTVLSSEDMDESSDHPLSENEIAVSNDTFSVKLEDKLSAIDGLDYNTALFHCGGSEELIKDIISDIAQDCDKRIKRMRKNLAENDIKSYQIEAHTIKSSMATIGLANLSERAKKHEFAARDNDMAFIEKDSEGFINEYTEICRKLQM